MQKTRFLIISIVIAFVLLIPFIAMQFTSEVSWTLFDFIVASILLLGASLLFDFAIRKIKNTRYRIAACIFIALAFLLIWAEFAVGILGT